MATIPLTITNPANDLLMVGSAVSSGGVYFYNSTTTFQGSVSGSSSGLYFKWYASMGHSAATDLATAHFNANVIGASSLNFTNTYNWGLGAHSLQFTCKDQPGETTADYAAVTKVGFQGGLNTMAALSISKRTFTVIGSKFLYPPAGYNTSGNVTFMMHCPTIMNPAWVTMNTRVVKSGIQWEAETDVIAARQHVMRFILTVSGIGGTMYGSDADACDYVYDIDPTHSSYPEYKNSVLSYTWNNPPINSYTATLKVYYTGNMSTYAVSTVTFEVTA